MEQLPFISILVAARNEADNITSCLKALSSIDYPKEKYEVWIGNDQSEDNTAALITTFIQDKPHFHLKNITENRGLAKGKANVLAQLAQEAKGEIYCITDADIQVPSSWLKGMLSVYQPEIGIITGFTIIKGKSWLDKLQAIDWMYALTLIQVASDRGIPVTAMGNNLLISKAAYQSVGGYENIPFSITEDYALFKQVIEKGWKFRNLITPEVTAITNGMSSIEALLHQRKRWMHGAMQLPFYMVMTLFFQALFFPLLVILFFFSPLLACLIWASKFLLQSVIILYTIHKINEWKLAPMLILYEGYNLLLPFAMLIFYFLPINIEWKGRHYTT